MNWVNWWQNHQQCRLLVIVVVAVVVGLLLLLLFYYSGNARSLKLQLYWVIYKDLKNCHTCARPPPYQHLCKFIHRRFMGKCLKYNVLVHFYLCTFSSHRPNLWRNGSVFRYQVGIILKSHGAHITYLFQLSARCHLAEKELVFTVLSSEPRRRFYSQHVVLEHIYLRSLISSDRCSWVV